MIIEDDDGNYEYYSDVYIIRELFSKAEIGETITFAQISEVLNRKMDNSTYSAIHLAKLLLEKEERMVFGNVRSVGYKRLTDSEIIEAFEVDRRRLRRRAQRAARRLTNVNDYGSLSEIHKITHQAGLGVLAAVARVTAPRMIESVKEVVSPIIPSKPNRVPIGRIIEIMMEKSKEEK